MKLVLPSFRVRFVHLVALWCYAVAQPTLSMLGGNPEFLVVRGSTRFEIVLFAVLLVLVVPTLALGVERLITLVSRTAGDITHLVLLGLLAIPLALFILSLFDPVATVALTVAGVIAVGLVVAYARFRQVRTFLTLSIILPLIGFGVFLMDIPTVVNDAAGAQVAVDEPVPVVMVVFDEFPTSSILKKDGSIDAVRYPNFARLAAQSTWYPRATTVHEYTIASVPAMLTGRLPAVGEIPTVGDHPGNLFTLLGESYAMKVQESVTYLCPKRYCPRSRPALPNRLEALFSDVSVAMAHRLLPESLSGDLPKITDRWSGFAGERLLVADDAEHVIGALVSRSSAIRLQYDRFLAGMTAKERARTVHFLHFPLPHSPWRFLPSGREYPRSDVVDGVDEFWAHWNDDPWLVAQGYQRHLLQVGYADRLLGRMLDRLERTGLSERALVIVTADHGMSFHPGGTRRSVRRDRLADVGGVPLFVKVPRQREGHVDRRPVRTIDILPTIAGALDVRLPWKVHGRSLFSAFGTSRPIAVSKRDGEYVHTTLDGFDRSQAATLRLKDELFGEGTASLYALGEHTQLLGQELSDVDHRSLASPVMHLDGADSYRDVRLSSGLVPSRVTGSVTLDIADDAELAIAVNGTIVALTRVRRNAGQRLFRAMVPDAAFHDGANRVEVFAIAEAEGDLALTRLGWAG
jgi:hypothetical protein